MASDEAYLNLLLWQTLSSTPNYLLWCSVLGLVFQCILLGILISQARRYLEVYSLRDPLPLVLVVVTGLGAVIAVLAIACIQIHRLISESDDYLTVSAVDNVSNLVIFGIAGALGSAGLVHSICKVWKISGATRFYVCGPLALGVLASWGLVLSALVHGASIPEITVINFDYVDVWMKKQAILYKCWAGLLAGMYLTTWYSRNYFLARQCKQFGEQKSLSRMLLWMVAESMLPVSIVALVFLIQLCVYTPSLANIGRTIMQCLPALSFISILNPLTYHHRLQSIIDTQNNVGLKPSDTGGPGGFGLITNRLAGLSSAFKSFSYKERQKDEEERSVRVMTVDSYVFENVSSQPPSHNFSNGYGDLSPVASPTPTLLPDSSSVVLAPTVPFDPYEFVGQLPQKDPQSPRTFVAPSFKSAVPSGKSIARTKSQKSSKKPRGGPILDPTGWPELFGPKEEVS
ncbi:hypothetical protein C356_05357 [Cryptococcus neoformans c45]|nr:hypothetical protein C356_05357 [Cryptococcus neoformans var. grubii c45]